MVDTTKIAAELWADIQKNIDWPNEESDDKVIISTIAVTLDKVIKKADHDWVSRTGKAPEKGTAMSEPTDQIAAKASAEISLYVKPLNNNEQVSATVYIKAAIEKAVQEYDERICNHIIAMIERLSARERKPSRAAQASDHPIPEGPQDDMKAWT